MNTIDTSTTKYRSSVTLPIHGRSRTGFTLIELLVVIALTVVLMTLLFGPLVAGFQYTSRAQTLSAAQDGQRILLREVSRDLSSAAALRDTQTRYLNINVLQKSDPGSSTGTQALVHMYNAYTDIVPPLGNCQDAASIEHGTCNGQTLVTDPTTNQSVIVATDPNTHTSYGQSPGVMTPIAPSTSFTRYFVGLKYPYSPLNWSGATSSVSPEPYSNIYENALETSTSGADTSASGVDYTATDVVKQNLNNTYVLYVATVSPYKKLTSPSQTTQVNSSLFATDSSGNPILDDPDFFRIVTATDYVSGTTTQYGATATAHNTRVYNWYKISHQVLAGRDYDMLAVARVGGNIDYAVPPTASNTVNVINPESGAAYGYMGKFSNAANITSPFLVDTTNLENNNAVLRVRPTFLISPGGITGESMQAQASDDVSQGVQATNNSVQQIQYIPTVYSTSQQQIQGSPSFSITAGGKSPFTTQIATSSTGALANGGIVAAGDLIEYDSTSTAVYDITQRQPIGAPASYIACSYNSTEGTLNFSNPAMPGISSAASADPGNAYNTWWCAPLSAVDETGEMYLDLGDPNVFPGNPLDTVVTPQFTVVVNSERVRGPDLTSGPSKYVTTPAGNKITYPLVPYTRVPLGTPVGPNQYSIVYYNQQSFSGGASVANARLYFGPQGEWASQLSQAGGTMTAQSTILVSYDVQNNSIPSGSGGPKPATITASYASANTMEVVAGIRVYDPVSKIAAFITNTETVPVGNGTR